MAITVDYVILHHLKKENGTNFIRLRVTHKRKSKYIKTNICIEPEDLTRSGNLKNAGKEDLADAEVRKWRGIVDAMPALAQEDMDVGEVVGYIKARIAEQEVFRLNFARYGLELARTKKESTGWNYKAAVACLVRFFGHEPDISEITVRAMRGFEEYIRNEGRIIHNANGRKLIQTKTKKSENAVAKYVGIVRAIYKSARLEFNDPDLGVMRLPIDIFEYYKAPAIVYASEPRDIPEEWVQMMIDQRRGLTGRQRLAVDAFLMSFCLMGINLVDMYKCAKAKDGVIHYNRTKTMDKKADRAEMFVRVEPCVAEIMKDYRGAGLLFDFSERYVSANKMTTAVNAGLRQWIEANGLEDFTFYSARHTWATLGASKRVGIDFALVTEGLSHSNASRRMDMVYIRKDWERVWDANAKVLELFDWK